MKRILTAFVFGVSLFIASGRIGYAGEGLRLKSENYAATLYRSSVAIEYARIHIATFDGTTKAYNGNEFDYNWGNCQLAAKLFQSQPEVKTTFWCEKGFYKE